MLPLGIWAPGPVAHELKSPVKAMSELTAQSHPKIFILIGSGGVYWRTRPILEADIEAHLHVGAGIDVAFLQGVVVGVFYFKGLSHGETASGIGPEPVMKVVF